MYRSFQFDLIQQKHNIERDNWFISNRSFYRLVTHKKNKRKKSEMCVCVCVCEYIKYKCNDDDDHHHINAGSDQSATSWHMRLGHNRVHLISPFTWIFYCYFVSIVTMKRFNVWLGHLPFRYQQFIHGKK